MLKLKLQYFAHLTQRAYSWKDPDAGKDWGQEEKGMTEDEMVGWHHRLNGHGFGRTPGVGDGQEALACCGSWGRKELDTPEWLNWTELKCHQTVHFKMVNFVPSSYFIALSVNVCLPSFHLSMSFSERQFTCHLLINTFFDNSNPKSTFISLSVYVVFHIQSFSHQLFTKNPLYVWHCKSFHLRQMGRIT